MRNLILVAAFLSIGFVSSVASAGCCCCAIRVRSVSVSVYRPAGYGVRVAAFGFGMPYFGVYGYRYPAMYGYYPYSSFFGAFGGGSLAVSWNRGWGGGSVYISGGRYYY